MAKKSRVTDGRDARALATLYDIFWSSKGWREPRGEPPEADLRYAIERGYLFDGPVRWTHDEMLRRAKAITTGVEPSAIGDAFLASLGEARLDWRSALPSFALVRQARPHDLVPDGFHVAGCELCGLRVVNDVDLDVLSFERHRFGGVRHSQLEYAVFDLERLAEDPPPAPSKANLEAMRELVALVPKHRKDADLARAFGTIVPSTRQEQRWIIDGLELSGVLAPAGQPSRVNAAAVALYFPKLSRRRRGR